MTEQPEGTGEAQGRQGLMSRPDRRGPGRRYGLRTVTRRLRAGFATSRPGRVGQPSAPTTRSRPAGLDVGRMNAGESLRDKGKHQSLSGPGSTAPT